MEWVSAGMRRPFFLFFYLSIKPEPIRQQKLLPRCVRVHQPDEINLAIDGSGQMYLIAFRVIGFNWVTRRHKGLND